MIYLSPIKVNLFLHIVGKRNDGYHNLETIFHLLDFYDEIEIKKTKNGKIKRVNNNNIAENDDLMIRAAKLLQKTTNCKYGATIKINKNIPIGGGLGGGSSNAATTLLALNDLWHTNLSNQALQTLGLTLGADVPVFILQKNAFATGIGEKLTPVILPNYYYLILCPNEHISTREIFSHSALTTSHKYGKIPSFLQAINLGNDCINAVFKSSGPDNLIKKSLDYLNTANGRISSAKLSGTGSCVFAIFKSKKDSELALKNYTCKNTKVFVARGIG